MVSIFRSIADVFSHALMNSNAQVLHCIGLLHLIALKRYHPGLQLVKHNQYLCCIALNYSITLKGCNALKDYIVLVGLEVV